MNDLTSDVLVFAKPQPEEVYEIGMTLCGTQRVIVDFCDDWFNEYPWYGKMLSMADAVTCPTPEMAKRIPAPATVIPDPYEFAEAEPHCVGDKLLWFGHGTNIGDLERARPQLKGYPLRVVSNIAGTIPWSIPTLLNELGKADIGIIPKYAAYKSSNRAVEAIRRGCFVVAEEHPSLTDIPGIWKGSLREGIEWAKRHQREANERTREAQSFISQFHNPKRISSAWRAICEGASGCISAADTVIGMGGSISTRGFTA